MNPHQLLTDRRISNAVRPAIEMLEERLCLSTSEVALPVVSANTATLRNGTLLVQGSNKSDTIKLSLAVEDHGLLQVDINGKMAGRFSLTDVNFVRTYGLGGSDMMTVDEGEGPITKRVYMFGGNGNDTMITGSGDDFVIGGKGDDLAETGDGNDYIEGNAGDDRLMAGSGRDTVNGGPGSDVINTGSGKDKVISQTKNQQVDVSGAIVATAATKLHYSGTQVTKRQGKRGRPAAFNGTVVGLTPQQIRKAYDFGDLSDPNFTNRGAGQTIAVVVPFHAPTALDDLNVFSSQFGLPAVSSKMFKYVYATGNQPAADRRWATEQALDVQWVHAIAPAAKILLVEADSDLTSDLFRAVAAASKALQPTGGVIAMTFEAPEGFTDRQFDAEFRTTFTDNVSLVAPAGDFPGEISHPGVDEEVLSVGGTTLTVDGAGNRVDESVWQNTGGGVSQVFDRPGYQNGLQIDGAGIGDTRVVPDVAFDADPASGVAVYSGTRTASGDTGWMSVGGTSVGAPAWAGLVTLANEKRAANGLELIGNGQLNNYIYGIARKYGDTTFNDIINGDNLAHQATVGFDAASGWGTPQATNLIDQLSIAESKNRVSSRVNLHFIWEGDLRKDLLFPLVDNVQAVINYTGSGTAKIAPQAADLLFDQGRTTDPVTGAPLTPPADQIDFGALGMDRIGNTIIGRGVATVVTADGYVANMVIRFEGRMFRVNGQDKITGKMYAISHHGVVLKQGQDAMFVGEFNSPGDSNP